MKKGRKATILLDTIDMSIMNKLKRNPVGVMELKKMMGLNHSNLKSHINRLHERKLIRKTPVPRSRKIILSVPKNQRTSIVLKVFKNKNPRRNLNQRSREK